MHRHRRERMRDATRIDVDWLEAGSVLLFAVLAASFWIAIGLLCAGRFRVLPLAVSCLAGAGLTFGVVLAALRRDTHGIRRPPPGHVLAALLVGALGSALFLHPAEYVFDGADGSVYLAIAGIIRSEGTVIAADPLASRIRSDELPQMFAPTRTPHLYNRFPGGIQIEIADGRSTLRPNFFHGYPVLVAAVDLLAGPFAGLRLNPLLGLISVLTVWLLGRRLSSPMTGTIAATLLALNFAQVWYARFPSTEMLSQCLLLAGLYYAVLAIDTERIVAGACAGAAFGLSAFVRIDSLLITPPVVALIIGASVAGRRRWKVWAWCGGVFGALWIHAAAYAVLWSGPYTARTLEMVRRHVGSHPGNVVLLALLVAAAVAFAVILYRARSLSRPVLLACGGGAAVLLVFGLSKEMAEGFFMRLISLPVMVAGIAGLVALLWAERLRAVPVALLFAIAAIYLITPFDVATMPWVLRRYVPILLPLTMLGVGHLTAALRPRLGPALLLLPVAIAGWFALRTWPIVQHSAMQNVGAQIRQIAGALPPDALVLWEPAAPSHLPLALNYEFGREGLVAVDVPDRGPALNRLALQLVREGRPIRLVIEPAQSSDVNPLRRDELNGLDVRFLRTATLEYDSMPSSTQQLPRALEHQVRHLDVYSVEPKQAEPARLPVRIEIGTQDFPYMAGGFYGPETVGSARIRWTGAVARIAVPPIDNREGGDRVLRLRLAAHRPVGVQPEVDLEWDGWPLGKVLPGGEFKELRVPLPRDVLASASGRGILTLRSNAFVPRQAGMGDDTRTLGVMVDWVSIE